MRILIWIGSSKKDYLDFPQEVQSAFGFELYLAQTGQHPPSAKAIKGMGSGVFELRDDFEGDTFRAVYAVRLRDVIYVLHAFKKKSKHGISTPIGDIRLVEHRLKAAVSEHARRFGTEA